MRKRNNSSSVVDVCKRELGQLSNRNFAHRFAASKDLVLRLDIVRKLDKHQTSVNTVSFNASGDVLVSGSGDRRIILWDWETGREKLSFHSGHRDSVLQAMIMPYTDDRCVVSCGADGEVRCAQILEGGKVETKLLVKHQGPAHKLVVEPGSPHCFYTCGEDGAVQHIDLRTGMGTCLFTCKPLQNLNLIPCISLNAIAIDSRNPNLFAVGGSDQFARLYDIRRFQWDGSYIDLFCPPHLIDYVNEGITGLAFSNQSELLVSYNEELIYLFARDPDRTFTNQVFGDSNVGARIPDGYSYLFPSEVYAKIKDVHQAYKGHMNCETVKDLNFLGPKCEYVMGGSDCGRIFIWKKNCGELIRVIKADRHAVNCVKSHPHATLLASSGIECDIKLWSPEAIDRSILSRKSHKDEHSDSYSDSYSSEEDEDEDDDDDDDDDDTDSDDDSDGDGLLNLDQLEDMNIDNAVDFVFPGESDYDIDDDISSEDFSDSDDDQNI